MLDYLQIIFWGITYLLIIAAGWKSRGQKLVAMPYTAGILNLGWELCALQHSRGFWGHILWLGLDVIIFSIGFFSLRNRKHKIIYVVLTYAVTMLLWYLFAQPDGMLITVFAIDLIMAAIYLLERKRLTPVLKVPIAIFRLIGDLFAGIYYAKASPLVAVMAVAVLLCNGIYLLLCCRERYSQGNK